MKKIFSKTQDYENGNENFKIAGSEKIKAITKMIAIIAIIIGFVIVIIILATKLSSEQAYELLQKFFDFFDEIKPYIFLFLLK